MKAHPVVFITVMDYDNLGVGYMASLLSQEGYEIKIVDFNKRKGDMLRALRKLDPMIIGLSVIYHNHIHRFAGLVNYLREKGISCHITAGGHYASLRYEELFRIVPGLDSVIRFEGEYPLAELAKCISSGKEWRTIRSLAWTEGDRIHLNPVWSLEKDLDKFPYPVRSSLKNYAFGRKMTTILAGRGCVYDCSFCNTKEFYTQALGPVKRIRKPESVVAEMQFLNQQKHCSVFLFHDDDFPVMTSVKTAWIERFCGDLVASRLDKKCIWKINCRPDEIDEHKFAMMKAAGLFLVFLGLEDGTREGLKKMNKKMSVTSSIKGIEILKKLELEFDFGFMLFNPYTTFTSLKENIGFLRTICSDGYTPVTFLKLVPFYNTRIAGELAGEGRLMISANGMDYEFLEEGMGNYYKLVMECFGDWMGKPDGVENISKWARNYLSVFCHFYDEDQGVMELNSRIRSIISESNNFMLNTLEEMAPLFKSQLHSTFTNYACAIFRSKVRVQHAKYRTELVTTMQRFMALAEEVIGI